MQRFLAAILVPGSLLLAAGCGGVAGDEPPSGSPEPAGQEVLGAVVYEHAYSETGRLTVFESELGLLYFGVTGKDGVDQPNLTGDATSLRETFQLLSPGRPVPSEVLELSRRLDAQEPLADAHELPGRAGAASPVEVSAVTSESELVPKSLTHFNNVVCQPHSGWLHVECMYFGQRTVFGSYGYNDSIGAREGFLDRAYGKNDGTVTATLTICDRTNRCLTPGVQLSPGGYWGYGNWAVATGTDNWRARIRMNSDAAGSLGLTRHVYQFDVE